MKSAVAFPLRLPSFVRCSAGGGEGRLISLSLIYTLLSYSAITVVSGGNLGPKRRGRDNGVPGVGQSLLVVQAEKYTIPLPP